MAEQDLSYSQVKIRLTTRHSDVSLPEDTGPILVNTNLRRYALSTLVNHLLETPKPVPFEFLINGSFLRTSIEDYLTANGISSETVLTAEYVKALIPPTYIASVEHDDWVSSVDLLSTSSKPGRSGDSSVAPGLVPGQERILSGSYDGLLRVWNMSSEVIATSPGPQAGGHTSSVKAAQFISPSQIASSGHDRTVRIWKYEDDPQSFQAAITPQIELYGHKASVNCLDTHGPSSRILSASDDHSIGIWSSRKSDAPAAPASLVPQRSTQSAKRRKIASSVSTAQRGPLSLLNSHTSPVTAVSFDSKDPTVAYSSSIDHTLRTWDLATASLVDTRTTAHALLSLTTLPTLNLIAVGTSARHITLIDPRASATKVSAMLLRGHINAVVALAADPNSSYGLLSGSHDGTCRIWDVRSRHSENEGLVGESIYTLPRESAKEEAGGGRRVGGEGVKVFGVCWDKEVGILSAGEDKRIQVNRSSTFGLQPEEMK